MKNKFLSYITGILFGFLFSIPWLLGYCFLNLSITYLSILTVFGVVLGYKLVGKDIYNCKQTKIYLILSSSFIIAFNVLLIAPMLLQIRLMGTVSLDFIAAVYSTKNTAILFIINLIPAITMVLIPAILLPIDFKKNKNTLSEGDEFLNDIENIFTEKKALSKEYAVKKNEIKKEIKKIKLNNIKKIFYLDVIKGFRIKSTKGNWYYRKKEKSFKFGLILSIFTLIIFASIWNIAFTSIGLKNNYNFGSIQTETNDDIEKISKNNQIIIGNKFTLEIPNCMGLYKDEEVEDAGIKFHVYRYIASNTYCSKLQVIQIADYGIEVYDQYENFDDVKDTMRNFLSDYGISDEGDISIGDSIGYYFSITNGKKLLNIDKKAIVICYYISTKKGLIQINTIIDSHDYNEAKSLSDNIVKSLKIND